MLDYSLLLTLFTKEPSHAHLAAPSPRPVVVGSPRRSPSPVVVSPAPVMPPLVLPMPAHSCPDSIFAQPRCRASDRLVGPGVDALVSPMAPYDCKGYSPPLPPDRVIIDPCAQPVTGVPLLDGHNTQGLLWNASTSWHNGTVVQYGGRSWTIVQTRVVDHYATYYPLPPAGAGLQIRTCQPDGLHEWVWDLS